MILKKTIFVFVLNLFLISLVNSLPNDNPSPITFNYPQTTNYSLIPTVNSSDYWDNLNTPADIFFNDLSASEINMSSYRITGDGLGYIDFSSDPIVIGDAGLKIYSNTEIIGDLNMTNGDINMQDDYYIKLGAGGLSGNLGADTLLYSDGTEGIIQIESPSGFLVENPKLALTYADVEGGGVGEEIYSPVIYSKDLIPFLLGFDVRAYDNTGTTLTGNIGAYRNETEGIYMQESLFTPGYSTIKNVGSPRDILIDTLRDTYQRDNRKFCFGDSKDVCIYFDGSIFKITNEIGDNKFIIDANDVNVTGNITADYFKGDGSELTNLPISNSNPFDQSLNTTDNVKFNIVNTTIIQKTGNTNVLDIQPDATGDGSALGVIYVTGLGATFFKNATTYIAHNNAGNSNPQIAIYGATNSGQKYATLGVDDYRRLVFGGNVDSTTFGTKLGIASDKGIEDANSRFKLIPAQTNNYGDGSAGTFMNWVVGVPSYYGLLTGGVHFTNVNRDWVLTNRYDDPHIFIHSYNDGVSERSYLTLSHNKTYGKIESGNGSLYLDSFNNLTYINDNVIINGNATFNNIYGGMWYSNYTGTPQNFAVDGVYYQIFFTNSTHLNGFSFQGGFGIPSNLTTQISGVYQVTYMAEGDGQNNHLYSTSVFVNEVNQKNCDSFHKMSAGGDIITQTGTCLINLNAGDKVSLRVADIGSTGTGNYYGGNIDLVKIGH